MKNISKIKCKTQERIELLSKYISDVRKINTELARYIKHCTECNEIINISIKETWDYLCTKYGKTYQYKYLNSFGNYLRFLVKANKINERDILDYANIDKLLKKYTELKKKTCERRLCDRRVYSHLFKHHFLTYICPEYINFDQNIMGVPLKLCFGPGLSDDDPPYFNYNQEIRKYPPVAIAKVIQYAKTSLYLNLFKNRLSFYKEKMNKLESNIIDDELIYYLNRDEENMICYGTLIIT